MLKEEKGITLIALIITIIVLLILAGVAINAVNAGNLFAHANNAAAAYSAAAEQENALITSYIEKMQAYDTEGGNGGSTPAVENSIWTERGLDTSKIVPGRLYEFTFGESDEYTLAIRLETNGDAYIQAGDSESITTPSADVDEILGNYISFTTNSMEFLYGEGYAGYEWFKIISDRKPSYIIR